MFNFTLQCVQIFHMVNIDVPAGVGAPPLNTQLPRRYGFHWQVATTRVVVITPQDAKYRIHINNINYICMFIMCLMSSMWEFRSDKMAKLEPQLRWPRAVLRLSCSRVSERSKLLGCWRASRLLSLLSCHLSFFCWAVNCLSYLWTRSGIVFCPPSSQPRSPSRWHHEWHVPKRYINYA